MKHSRQGLPKAWKTAVRGAAGFAAVSIAAYSIWAFAPRAAGSEAGMYAVIAAVYLGGGGCIVAGLLDGERRMARAQALFIPAFLLYAAAWSATWFAFRNHAGEWAASLLGIHAFSAFAWVRLGCPPGYWTASMAAFVLHSAGYFMGEFTGYFFIRLGPDGLDTATSKVAGKLAWGALHGLGLGAALGILFHRWQTAARDTATNPDATADTAPRLPR